VSLTKEAPMPNLVKKKVIYFSVVVEEEYETEDEVLDLCYRDLKHGSCGLDYSHTAEEEFEE
jgi:hypothetical protein